MIAVKANWGESFEALWAFAQRETTYLQSCFVHSLGPFKACRSFGDVRLLQKRDKYLNEVDEPFFKFNLFERLKGPLAHPFHDPLRIVTNVMEALAVCKQNTQ